MAAVCTAISTSLVYNLIPSAFFMHADVVLIIIIIIIKLQLQVASTTQPGPKQS